MRKKDPRTKCIKRKLTKCKEVFRAYDDVQNAYADKLENDPDVSMVLRTSCVNVFRMHLKAKLLTGMIFV